MAVVFVTVSAFDMNNTLLNVVIVTVNDSLYAPLYVSNILLHLRDNQYIRISKVYTIDVTKGQKLWPQLKRRWQVYGGMQFILFLMLVLKSKFLAKFEAFLPFKRPYSLKRWCQEHAISYDQITNVNDPAFVATLKADQVDVLVSIGVPQRFKHPVLETVPYPLNVHSSLLPKYAGLMGLFWAVYHQEREAGVSLFVMDDAFDDGDILGQVSFEIAPMTSLHQLYLAAIEHGSKLIASVLEDIALNRSHKVEQDMSQRSYFSFPKKAERQKFFQLGFKFFHWGDLLT